MMTMTKEEKARELRKRYLTAEMECRRNFNLYTLQNLNCATVAIEEYEKEYNERCFFYNANDSIEF